MSRASILVLLVLLVVVGVLLFLGTRTSEVPQTHVEKDMLANVSQK